MCIYRHWNIDWGLFMSCVYILLAIFHTFNKFLMVWGWWKHIRHWLQYFIFQVSCNSQEGRQKSVNPIVLATSSQESLSVVITITNKCICSESWSRPSFEDILCNLQHAVQVQATADGEQFRWVVYQLLRDIAFPSLASLKSLFFIEVVTVIAKVWSSLSQLDHL